jgi:hypothetical protein
MLQAAFYRSFIFIIIIVVILIVVVVIIILSNYGNSLSVIKLNFLRI